MANDSVANCDGIGSGPTEVRIARLSPCCLVIHQGEEDGPDGRLLRRRHFTSSIQAKSMETMKMPCFFVPLFLACPTRSVP